LMKNVPNRDRIPLVRSVPGKRSGWRRHAGRQSFPPPAPDELPALIRELCSVSGRLEHAFADQHFLPVHMTFDAPAPAWAAYVYGLTIWELSCYEPNAMTPDGRLVQVLRDYGDYVRYDNAPVSRNSSQLIILRIGRGGNLDKEIYNGPTALAWAHREGGRDENELSTVSLTLLKKLGRRVPKESRLAPIRPWPGKGCL